MWLLAIALAIFLLIVISNTVTKQKEDEQRSIAEKNHVLVTEKDIAESDRLMQTDLFQELAKQIQENVTNDVLWDAKYSIFVANTFLTRHSVSIKVEYGKDEDDFGVSHILGADLTKMGYKAIKNYDKIRVLFYSIGRLEGFCFRITQGSARYMPVLEVRADSFYWEKIYQQEKIRLADEKNAGLKDFF